MNEDRIKELFSNEDFVKDLFESKSYEEAQAKLAAKDVDISMDDLRTAVDLLRKKQNGDLSDESLEEVAGGGVGAAIISIGIIGGYVGIKTGFHLSKKC